MKDIEKLLQEKKYEEALEKLHGKLQSDPLDFQALFYRGLTFRRMDEFKKSHEDFETLRRHYPDNASVLSELGLSYFYLEDMKEALNYFDKAQEKEPQNPYRYSSRAYIKDKMGNTAGAISDYEEAIRLDPSDDIAHNNLGMLQEKLGRMSQAKKLFDTADKLAGRELNKKPPLPEEEDSTHDNGEEQKSEKQGAKAYNSSETTAAKPNYWSTMKEVITTKQGFKEFADFIKSGFKKGK